LPERPRPIFIVSAMGSGSTLIRLILDSHERIGIPQETGFMRAYQAHQFIPLKWSGRNWARRMGWSREELDEELAAFYDRIFSRYIERQGKQRWGDKTPLHTWHIDGLARLYPDAQFIAMLRHPGGSVGSNMHRFGHPFNRSVIHVDRYDREIARQATVYADRFVIVRYEDLVLRPEPLLRELLDWLGEPWSDNVLQHHEVQTARGGRLVVEGTNRIDDPIDVSRVAKWHKRMSEPHRRTLTARLGRLSEFYGYDTEDPAVLSPLRDDGKLLIRGADIAARTADYPDLELEERLEPMLAERQYHPGRIALHGIGEFIKKSPPPPDPPFLVRLWKVLPMTVRRELHPFGRRVRHTYRRLRKRLRR
jgi:Sulfotransferase family